ncbi:flagellar hook-associated protein FlgK [Massilia horti]|uniref:Flagellar hook-associated protein 1 n=1 Tax=Massilia horti TaxID=2562153 RepID=A0A4Y9T033_9BURK|nr:flagellar hook-associated protein FlgK [Massilia horti]TFW32079.1 flagellar hook-associated protein FlgK [Massilia horti]
MSLLSIGKSGLFAAQAALSTTGHNITNANVAGYSRQGVVQSTAIAMGQGYGFLGNGTQIAQVKRYTDEFLNAQVRTAQASSSAMDTYNAQISQIDNLLADSTTGLSPALQGFFGSVHDLTQPSAGVPARGTLLTSADILAARFQAMNARMEDIRQGVNGQITSNVTVINTYAQQIAKLNDQIALASGGDLRQPNDLMDQRDQLVMELNKHIKATVSQADNNSLTISIGNGQPLVVGKRAFELAATTSPTDLTRVEVGYVTGDKVTVLADSALTGGELGGLLEFRSKSLDLAQNSLGRIAIGLAETFNAQHHLGLDADGNFGGDFFSVADPFVSKNFNNNQSSTTTVTAKISDATQLTTSDYQVDFDGTDFTVTRLSDNQKTKIAPFPQTVPQTIDGVDFSISGSAAPRDSFLVRPTSNGAASFKVAITSSSQIAAAAPIRTKVPLANKGTGTISEGTVDANYLANKLAGPLTLAFDSATGSITGFPATQPVTVVAGGVTTTYAAGAAVPFTAGASYTVAGMSFSMNGKPADGDQFVIEPNTGLGDVRNAGLLAGLQSKNIFNSGSTTYQSAYADLVARIGNKAREVQVNAEASKAQLAQAQGAAEDVSGVNLDEEAANLLKYQQAYQAASKVMQIADTIFNAILAIGR